MMALLPIGKAPRGLLLMLLAAAAVATAQAQRSPYIPNASLDTLLDTSLPYEERRLQTRLLADLGNDIDGIKLLLTNGHDLGSGFRDFPTLPANLTTDPGLSYLATAVQAYLALYGGISIVSSNGLPTFRAPTNTWYHAARSYVPGTPLPGNGGTLYSALYYTLKDGPLLVSTPPYNGTNLWTIVFYDVYSTNYNVLASYRGANAGGSYLIVPPDWEGSAPAGVHVVYSRTLEGLLLGRTFTNPDALSAINFNLQWNASVWADNVSPIPDSLWPLGYPESGRAAANWDNPTDPLLFWRVAGEVFRRNGAPHIEDPLARLLPSIGLYEDYGFVQSSLTPLARDALIAAPYFANRILVARYIFLGPPELNHWLAPENNGAFGTDYVSHAAIQKGFYIANKIEDSAYVYAYVDENGDPLNGAVSDYSITFDAAPPVPANSFWSLQAGNLDRWNFPAGAALSQATASTAAGFYTAPNGSIAFRLSATAPPAGTTAEQRGWNYVAVPPAYFNLNLRLYVPLPSVLNNTYVPPRIVKVPRASRR